MIVVDTNIVVYLLINGERTQSAQSLWRYDPQFVSLAQSLAVPLISEDNKRLGKQCSDVVVTMENYTQGTSKNVLFV